jgi:RHS repeat-associated protein
MPDSNFVYFYHPDHLGSTSYATDADGELYEHVQYFPSGETWVDQRSNTERLPHLFSGKELDQETGLYYFGARYYDPRVGLWASTDPAQTEYLDGAGVGGVYSPINLATYTYAASNPLRFVDPDGRSWLDWVQNALDGASIALDATGIGGSVSWLPDVVNAGISAVRGDWTGAGMSLSAAVPYVGAPANAGRLGRALAKHGDEAIDLVRDAGKAADGFRSFTQRNFRENLTRLTGRAPDGAQAHHIFPVKFEGKFKEAGINIHDPKYGAWWNTSGHKQAAHDYNAAWQEFFRTNPSSEQIKQFGRDIAKKYALDVHF